MLNPKMIPGKTYEQLMEENIGKIPIYSDEWTNFNPSDPGITILENLSAFQVLQQDQMEQVPENVRAKLLMLLGYKPEKGKGARVYLEPSGAAEDFMIPADEKFFVGDISFETTLAAKMTASRILGVYGRDGIDGKITDFSHVLDKNMRMNACVFGKEPTEGAELYIVLDKPLRSGEKGILYARTDERYGRNPFRQEDPELFAGLKWSCYTEKGFVPMQVKDETHGFLTSGLISFTQPKEPSALYEEEGISGYIWRVRLERAGYDIAPELSYLTGFLFPVVQKETQVIAYSFQKPADITLTCGMLEDGYVRVFCKEQKGTSYRLYEECPGEQEQGRYYYRRRDGIGRCTFQFQKKRFGYGPEHVKNAVKIVIYNEEMMRRYYIGEIFGYDEQELKLPGEHIVTETFSLIAERESGDGEKYYDFVKPGRMGENELSYYLYENEGKIVILDAGDYVGAKLYLASMAVTLGADGNVRAGNTFISRGFSRNIHFTNPTAGSGGKFQESLEDVRRRFIRDMNTPYTAVTGTDFETIVKNTPGLCISKVHAWMDVEKNEVQTVVLPKGPERFPKLSPIYYREIERQLEEHRMLSARVCVRGPVYQGVVTSGVVYVKPHYENCREQISEVIKRELDYVQGDQNFGEVLRFDRLFHAVEALECVVYLSEFSIAPEGGGLAVLEGVDIRPDENCLLYPGKINLEIIPMLEKNG